MWVLLSSRLGATGRVEFPIRSLYCREIVAQMGYVQDTSRVKIPEAMQTHYWQPGVLAGQRNNLQTRATTKWEICQNQFGLWLLHILSIHQQHESSITCQTTTKKKKHACLLKENDSQLIAVQTLQIATHTRAESISQQPAANLLLTYKHPLNRSKTPAQNMHESELSLPGFESVLAPSCCIMERETPTSSR